MSIQDIPAFNACMNGLATILLAAGFIFIKSGNEVAHRRCMKSAFAVSSVFLVGYVLHKILMKGVHTPFAGGQPWQTIYYVMLLTHVILAMAILPLIFITINHAIKDRREKHRAWAKWTFPAWFYVSVTGVLVYFFLYQWFPAK